MLSPWRIPLRGYEKSRRRYHSWDRITGKDKHVKRKKFEKNPVRKRSLKNENFPYGLEM
jgi:hypothetical protein